MLYQYEHKYFEKFSHMRNAEIKYNYYFLNYFDFLVIKRKFYFLR